MATFQEIDNALYEHERPAYHYWAYGAGSDPTINPVWVAERERLQAEWLRLCPWKTPPELEKSWWVRFYEAVFWIGR